jgi:nucleoside-diphosphate-sugar epimerase
VKRILITGSNGFIGLNLCQRLSELQYDLICPLRSAKASSQMPDSFCAKKIIVGDIGPDTEWNDALKNVDTVIHLAARVHVLAEKEADPLRAFRGVNVDGTKRLASAAYAEGVKRFIYISSIGVNGQTTGPQPFTEACTPQPYDPYTLSKWEAEQALQDIAQETGLEIVILRPPLVYGENAPGNFSRLIKLVDSGIPLPLGSVNNRRSFVYVDNLVDAIVHCIEHPAAVGQTFLVSDGQDVSTPGFIRLIAHSMGREPRLIPFPPRLLKTMGRLLGKESEIDRLIGSLVLDISKIRRELDWTPPCTMEQGLRKAVEGNLQS